MDENFKTFFPTNSLQYQQWKPPPPPPGGDNPPTPSSLTDFHHFSSQHSFFSLLSPFPYLGVNFPLTMYIFFCCVGGVVFWGCERLTRWLSEPFPTESTPVRPNASCLLVPASKKVARSQTRSGDFHHLNFSSN